VRLKKKKMSFLAARRGREWDWSFFAGRGSGVHRVPAASALVKDVTASQPFRGGCHQGVLSWDVIGYIWLIGFMKTSSIVPITPEHKHQPYRRARTHAGRGEELSNSTRAAHGLSPRCDASVFVHMSPGGPTRLPASSRRRPDLPHRRIAYRFIRSRQASITPRQLFTKPNWRLQGLTTRIPITNVGGDHSLKRVLARSIGVALKSVVTVPV
jgi:hypothetical protein